MLRKKTWLFDCFGQYQAVLQGICNGAVGLCFRAFGQRGVGKKRVIVAGGAVWGKRKYRFLRRVWGVWLMMGR